MAESKLKVLIVEDESSIGDHYETVLNEAGFQVWLVTNLNDFNTRFKAVNPDIVLTDQSFPDMSRGWENKLNGFEVITTVRQSNRPEVKIVWVAGSYEENHKKVMMLGANLALCKPVLDDKLTEVFAQIASDIARARC